MPKMIVSIDGVVVREVELDRERTTLGRRPYNDIVIDNLAVSGEHAVIHWHDNRVEIEDLDSTNGTYVNAKSIKRQELHHGDMIDVGKYKIRFVHDAHAPAREKTPVAASGGGRGAAEPGASSFAPMAASVDAVIRVVSGPAAGREVVLQKVVTTIGKPGVAVASITRRSQSFVLAHVEGATRPLLNGVPMGDVPMALKEGDLLELAGTQMQFAHR